jgi:hypothetical protein
VKLFNTQLIYDISQAKERGKIMALQHNDDDLDWAYQPYLRTNTKCNYDSSGIEGPLERE